MRKLLSWIVNLAALLAFLLGGFCLLVALIGYDRAINYFDRATFNAECVSPADSEGCALLYENEPDWRYGVEITDNEVLVANAAALQDGASGVLAVGGFLIGTSGVLLAASVIVHGQAQARKDAVRAGAGGQVLRQPGS